MLFHQNVATDGLYPGTPSTSTFLVSVLGLFQIVDNPDVDVGTHHGYSTRWHDRDRVEQEVPITVMLSFKDLYWHNEYQEVKYSKMAIRAKLKGEQIVKREKKLSDVSVEASINKPTVKVDLKGK